MGVEIERKFLVLQEFWTKELAQESKLLRQAYLSDEPQKTIRVRTANQKGYLTIKGQPQGISRQEFEYEIPLEDAHQLIDNFAAAVVEKIRHYVRYKGKLWEVDEFLGLNEGLWVAEIELSSVDENFEKPRWVGQEVSNDSRYLNALLAKHPFRNW